MRAYWGIYTTTLWPAALFVFLFFLVEQRFGSEPQRPAQRLFNVLYFPVVLAWIAALTLVQSAIATPLLAGTGGGALRHLAPGQAGLRAELSWTVLVVFVWDLWQYWVHRLQHASATLWRTHRLHHSDRAMNSSTAQRNALSHYVLHGLLWIPVLLILARLPVNLAVGFVLFRFWGFVNHANLRLHFRRMTIVFSGPQWHRIHHSILPEHRDKNFAAFFPVIDRLFGTYYRPAVDEYPPTGVIGDPAPIEAGVTLIPAPGLVSA